MAVNLISYNQADDKIYIHDRITSTILDSFAGPAALPSGLAFDGANLISCNFSADKIYSHDGISSTVLFSFDSPDDVPQALAYSGVNLISSDTHTDKIYVHDGISSTILFSFASPDDLPTGLAFNETNLISCDASADEIYIHDAISVAILDSFASPGSIPSALTFDDPNLISSDRNTHRIYIHDGITSTISSSFASVDRRGLATAPTIKPSTPTDLKCEDLTNPSEITDKNPELTAVYSHIYGYEGRYYRVQVSKVSDLSVIIWDSGKTRLPTDIGKGDTCQPITVRQTLPLDGTKYYWRIRFWDVDDNEGDWSTESAWFIMSMISEEFPSLPLPDSPSFPEVLPPRRYRLSIANQAIQCEADEQNLLDLSFTLRKNGGCAEFSLSFGKPLEVNLGDEIKVYLFGSIYPWYRGRILDRDRNGSSSKVKIYSGYGHFEQLSASDLVDVEYGAGFAIDDLRDAVIDILDTDVRPYTTLISNDNSKIDDPSYTITHIKFDKVKPIDALRNLSEMASGWEFGVDENGDFYFRAESGNVIEKKWVGKHLATYLPKENMRNVVNMIYLEGGTLSVGSNYDTVISDADSILEYGRRSDKATIPSGMDTAEIQRWGNDLLNKKKDSIVSARITGIDIEITQSRIWPRGLMKITGENGEDSLELPIIAVVYHITPAGITADIELGIKRPSTSDVIQEINRQVKQEREQLASDVEQLASGAAIEDDAIHDFHIDWGTGANQVSADDVPFTPAGDIAAADVQAAIEELDAEKIADVIDVIKDTHIDWGVGVGEVSAVDIPIADGGGVITATDVEAALQEIFLDYQAGGASRTLGGNLDMNNYLINNILGLDFKVATELTVAAGVITVTQSIHTVDTSGDDATDDLDTINGGAVTQFIILRAEDDARTVVVKHNTGNIWLKGKVDLSLDDLEDGLALFWDGTKWFDLGAGGVGAATFLALTDTPANFVAQIGKIPKVNDAENALEFDLARHLNNLCRNAAFASRSGGVTTEPDEWELELTPTFTYNAAELGYGDFAILITAVGAANEGIKQTLTHLKPSAKYQVLVRVNAAAGDTARLLTTGAGTDIDVETVSVVPVSLTGEFITDAAANDVTIKLLAKADGDTARFCGITCVEGDTPPGVFIRGFNGDLDVISAIQWEHLSRIDNVTSKAGAAVLTVAEAGTILVTAGAGYTLTLPTAVNNTGLTYKFVKTDVNYNIITLDGNAAETIAGSLTYTLLNTPQAKVTIVSDGTNWQVINEDYGIVPRCSVWLGAHQLNLTSGVLTKVQLDTEIYDIGGNFDNAVNYRFVAPIPGYYQCNVNAGWRTPSIVIDKKYGTGMGVNGIANVKASHYVHAVIQDTLRHFTAKDLYLNTGDFVEQWAAQYSGVNTVDIEGGHLGVTFMTVVLLRKV